MHDAFPILIFIGLLVSVPLAAILTHHQRKMTALIHGRDEQGMGFQSEQRLQAEISELRQLVTRQAIQIDDLQNMQRRLLERSSDTDAVRNRLGT